MKPFTLKMKLSSLFVPKKGDPIPILIVIMITGITFLHYGTDISKSLYHDIYRRLYYIPIILAAFRYQLKGGIIAALTITLIYLPFILLQWSDFISEGFNKLLEIVLYNFVGIITGVLVSQQEAERMRYQHAAEELQKSIHKIENQSRKIIETEEQLRTADRLAVLGELTASLAHEIRNPLGSIKGAAAMLIRNSTSDEAKKELSGILLREVNRMNEVVENYLSIARPNRKPVRKIFLTDIIHSIQILMAQKTKKHKIALSAAVPSEPIILPLEAGQFHQILLNLILNAVDAMPEGGQITVLAQKEQGHILSISVKDNGVGIHPGALSRIWDPFFTTKPSGTGLGLAITRRIIEQVGGKITVESTPEKGTSFNIEIPYEGELEVAKPIKNSGY
jgi:signal transduction histidine kinase